MRYTVMAKTADDAAHTMSRDAPPIAARAFALPVMPSKSRRRHKAFVDQ